jgi:hypothetical protein
VQGKPSPLGEKSMPGVRTPIDNLIRKDLKLPLPWNDTRQKDGGTGGALLKPAAAKVQAAHPALRES